MIIFFEISLFPIYSNTNFISGMKRVSKSVTSNKTFCHITFIIIKSNMIYVNNKLPFNQMKIFMDFQIFLSYQIYTFKDMKPIVL